MGRIGIVPIYESIRFIAEIMILAAVTLAQFYPLLEQRLMAYIESSLLFHMDKESGYQETHEKIFS